MAWIVGVSVSLFDDVLNRSRPKQTFGHFARVIACQTQKLRLTFNLQIRNLNIQCSWVSYRLQNDQSEIFTKCILSQNNSYKLICIRFFVLKVWIN